MFTDGVLVDEQFYKQLLEIDPVIYEKSNHSMKYGFKLENVKKYDNPIYVKGKLGLWNYDL